MSAAARAAALGAPPKPVNRGLDLGEPPIPQEAKNNIQKPDYVQFNVRLHRDKHDDIKIASIRERKTLTEYLEFLHDYYQSHKGA